MTAESIKKIYTKKACLPSFPHTAGFVVVCCYQPCSHKHSYQNTKKSTEKRSHNGETYKIKGDIHVGMRKKPLEPYHPYAKRSRLPQATIVMPYKNSSQIVLGDRR